MVDKNIYIVQGEISVVVAAIKRNSRWSTHTPLDEEQDPLLNSFSHLKETLNNIKALYSVCMSSCLCNGSPGQGVLSLENTAAQRWTGAAVSGPRQKSAKLPALTHSKGRVISLALLSKC
ncbi:Golgi-specific brefeldin A-resistance guanine nucleotide exchange factor 1 [Anabarilius grahami]|uniref:Golgi-specific brefeldin A-resistance guanine nucleotide exchange factor 1 n=1 Tax=Anabarilius grahami TaxID=495550 RepID=A0A3N0XYP0_ANAGA|nr:Golgi-specific brefeldin A-resistance guanine nucleotide exchange factor 1 [Anabarilius grahami]